jgi:hypothetical protein
LAEPETETVKVIRDSRYSAKNYGYLSKTQEWCKTGNCCTHLKIPAKLRGGGVFLLKQVSCEAFSMLAVKQKCRTFSFKRKIAAEKQCFLRRKAENPAQARDFLDGCSSARKPYACKQHPAECRMDNLKVLP